MPDIRPFRAFHYGARLRAKIRELVCPPYDVISAVQRQVLVQKNPLNFVRVEMPVGDVESRYLGAAALWKEWLDEKILEREAAAAYYVYESRFRSQIDGRALSRLGFFAALKTVPWGDGVFPHEKTLPTAKADRLMLFQTIRVQTSPIQLLVQDPSGRVQELVARNRRGAPCVQFSDEAGVTHRLWKWKQGKETAALEKAMALSPAAIADGHHRYETSLAYGRWARKTWGRAAGAASAHVLAYFNASNDPGLEILPTHRSIPWEKRRFVNLAKWGKLTPVAGLATLKKLMDGKMKPGLLEIGLCRGGKFFLYKLSKAPPALLGTPEARLAVACLHAGPLKGLGKEDFFFTRNPGEAAEYAQKRNGWAFFLAPNTVAEVLDVATAGRVMPPKSTYFYPKIPSGLLSQSLLGAL